MHPIVIPPVILWTLGALGVLALTKVITREWHRVNAELHPYEPVHVRERDIRAIKKLRRDPLSGVYRPD